jgi:hypothetical protein
MNRKISLRVLALVVLLGLCMLVIFGWSVRHVLIGGTQLGVWRQPILAVAEFPSLAKEVFKQLVYRSPLIIESRFPKLDGFIKDGKIQDGAVADHGYLLLSAYDPIRLQSTIKLVRITDQRVMHEWVPDVSEMARLFENKRSLYFSKADFTQSRMRFVNPFLLADGGLLVQSGGPLFRLDACSKIKWKLDGVFHHSIEQDSDGNFWVPSAIEPSSPDYSHIPDFRDNAIAKISPDGKLLFLKSVSRILEENGYRGLIFGVESYTPDVVHLNQIQPAHYSTPFWNKGDLLLSIASRSTIFIYRPGTDKVTWLRTGPWLSQHDPDFIGDYRISVFGNNTGKILHNRSELNNDVYVIDMRSGEISRPYSKALKMIDARTPTQGRQEILDGGDLFIEETDFGRIARVGTSSVVWEFVVRVDESSIGMLAWSRYLSEKQVAGIIEVFERSNCH